MGLIRVLIRYYNGEISKEEADLLVDEEVEDLQKVLKELGVESTIRTEVA